MAKQTLVFENPADLSVKDGQLLICQKNSAPAMLSLEDISLIIIDNHSVHLTVPLITLMADNNINIVFCNERHMPVTMTMDLDSNHEQTLFFRLQIDASVPLKKQLWKQVVENKISNQSLFLQKLGKGTDLLKCYSENVKSGDATNREAIAAKIYWKHLFGKNFVRDRIGPSPNDMLNYGYAILRSAIARSLMNSGLLPTLGIFHKNRFDSFPLTDDIMEPYRPFIDEKIYELYSIKKTRIDRTFKRNIIELFYDRLTNDELSKTTHSLSNIYIGEGRVIYYPKID